MTTPPTSSPLAAQSTVINGRTYQLNPLVGRNILEQFQRLHEFIPRLLQGNDAARVLGPMAKAVMSNSADAEGAIKKAIAAGQIDMMSLFAHVVEAISTAIADPKFAAILTSCWHHGALMASRPDGQMVRVSDAWWTIETLGDYYNLALWTLRINFGPAFLGALGLNGAPQG